MLTKFALRRPVAIIVSLIALFVFGFSALLGTPLELTPSMSMPMFIISTVYPGAGPDEVDTLVTKKVLDATSTLTGLKTTQSISSENSSLVLIELDYGSDMNKASNDLQKKLNMISNSLPEDTMDPIVIEMQMDSMPVLQASVEATGDMDLLAYMNDNIVPEFEKLSGVASVQVYGGRENYMQVRLDPAKLNQYKLDMNTVAQMIATADFSLPAGKVEQGGLSLSLRGGVTYPSPAALSTMPLTLKSGDIIHLSDIATVAEAQKDASSISRYNGKQTVSVAVTKRDSASTKEVTSACLRAINQINNSNVGLTLKVTANSSDEIWESLEGVIVSIVLAIVISMLILYLFLGDFRASLIVGTSMPISVLVTLIIMSFSGMTFNMLSLGGLSIGVGMMVDNSIVILDSCFKKRDEHRSFHDAAIEGARVVTSAVAASTLTTVVVFLPIALMQGISGQLFRDAGFTVVFALTASLISALTLVPLLFFRFKPTEKKQTLISRGLRRLEQRYAALVRVTLHNRSVVVAASVSLLLISFAMLPFIGVELMPATDAGSVSVSITTRPGLKLDKIDEILTRMEKVVVDLPDLDSYTVSGSSGANPMSNSASNASISITLKKDRTVETADVVNILRQATKDYTDCEVQVASSGVSMGGGGTDIVQDFLVGNDLDALLEGSSRIKAEMLDNPGVIHVTTSLTDGSPQAEILVDPVKSGAVGLTPVQVMSSVNAMVGGKEAATIRMDGKDYAVRVEFPKDTYRSVGDLAGMNLTSPAGMQVPLLDIASIEYTTSPQQVMRYNSQYVVSITGQTIAQNAAKISGEVTKSIQTVELPTGVTHFFGGSIQTMQEEFAAIFTSLATAVFLVFMVMAIQFNSIRFSLMVMLSVPFSLIGAFGGLLATKTTISMTSLMGIILLVGIVVNNAIVLIDYANQLRASGMRIENALIKAGRTRLRPILMTTLTTVLGMVPMAIGMGSNAEMMRGMAMVVIGGLSASTVLTLILIPTFYTTFSKKDSKNPNLRPDDGYDPDHPPIEYDHELPTDRNQSEELAEELPV